MKRLVGRTERRLKRVLGEIDFLEKNAVEALKCQEDGDDDDDGSVEEESNDESGEKHHDKEEKVESDDDEEEEEVTDGATQQEEEEEETTESVKDNNNNKTKNKQQEEETPEVLRQQLRKIAMERDRSLTLLQKKLRDKNEEYTALMKLKQRRTMAIKKIEVETREREEWERGRQEVIA